METKPLTLDPISKDTRNHSLQKEAFTFQLNRLRNNYNRAQQSPLSITIRIAFANLLIVHALRKVPSTLVNTAEAPLVYRGHNWGLSETVTRRMTKWSGRWGSCFSVALQEDSASAAVEAGE